MFLSGRWLPSSLTNRVFALYGITLLLFVGGGLGLFLQHQFKQQVQDTELASVMLVEVVAQAVQGSVVIGDFDTVQKILNKGVQSSQFASAVFIDAGGSKVQADNRTAVLRSAPAWLVRWVQQSLGDVNRSVSVGGKDYGVLRLQFDVPAVAAGLWSLALLALGGGLASLVVGLVLIRVALARWLGGLARLGEVVQTLGTGAAQSEAVVIPHAPVEIQRLVDLFNQTAVLVRQREATRLALDQQKFALDQHAIVSVADADGTILYANDRFCEISGFSRQELVGSNQRDIRSSVHPDAFFAQIWQTLSGGQVWHGEICNSRRNGALYWADTTIVPLPSVDGCSRQYITIRTDITDRKDIEQSLVAARDQAEQASVAKSQFVANMSHEIRTPMNAILGMLKLLQGTELTTRQLDFVGKTEGAARSLLGLLNDILDFSKVEAGKMVLDHRPFHLDQMLKDLSVILAANVAGKAVEMRFDVEPTVPRALVGDDMRLAQVLINLGGNAIKFTNAGEVVMRVRLLEQTATDVQLEFAMCDSGIGIAPEHQAHIFSGFSQAEASTTRRFGGTGLGLSISARLVGLFGGTLQVDSAVGQGSTFHFQIRLPLADAQQAQRLEATLNPQLAQATGPRLQGLRILVVEDNKINQMVAQGLLSREGADVTLADDGELGVRAVADTQPPFDVVLMDLQMPVMDGYAATRAIRQQLGMVALPIIAMTANAMPADRVACLEAGMNDHMGKPFELDQLVATLLRYRVRVAQPPSMASVEEPLPVEPTAPSAQLAVAAGGYPPGDLDVPTALNRMGGDTTTFATILRTFAHDMQRFPQQLADHLHAGDLAQALRMVHTLKGLAATVGARHLAGVAAQLQDTLKADTATALQQTDHAAMVHRVQSAIDATAEALVPVLAQYAPRAPEPEWLGTPSVYDQARIMRDVQDLRGLLANSDMQALQLLALLRQAHGHVLGAAMAPLEAAMAALDFDQADAACVALQRQFFTHSTA